MKDYRICETVETLENYGTTTVSTEDLLSVILNSREKAKNLLHSEATLFAGQLDGLKGLLRTDFDGLKYLGLSKTEAARILASIELGIRAARMTQNETEHISSLGDAAQYFISRLRNETHEKFYVMLLNTKNRVMKVKQISEGSLTSAVVHPREVFAPAVINHAACILVAHNHPSGDPYPSTEDRHLTEALNTAGEALGIPVLDHVVIGDGRYYSFKEHGDL